MSRSTTRSTPKQPAEAADDGTRAPEPKAPEPKASDVPGAGPAAPLPGREQKLRAVRAAGDENRWRDRAERVIWFDARDGADGPGTALTERVFRGGLFTGIVLPAGAAQRWRDAVPPRFDVVLAAGDGDDLAAVLACAEEFAGRQDGGNGRVAIAAADQAVLARVRAEGVQSCLLAHVDDRDSLHEAIQRGVAHDHLLVSFRDPTNIPLELVIATLQATSTVLVKSIAPGDVDDAVVTLGVMEVGADGVLFTPRDQGEYDALAKRLTGRRAEQTLAIEPAVVVRSEPVGMGHRSCLDLATLFEETEGMLVGSTSQGGVLCCAEVFHLPYMELRPFRVNAGAVHSYVYNAEDRTDYMSELAAGSEVLVVDVTGRTRRAAVGRVKTEVRPLRLIEVEFDGGERVNVLMQDDWHVRIFSADGKPLNITALRPGDRVLGHRADPGRHVGISVDEFIVER